MTKITNKKKVENGVENRHEWMRNLSEQNFLYCRRYFSKYGEYVEGVEKNICEVIKKLSAAQKVIILGKLEREFEKWNATPFVEIESAWALGAYQSFACEDYACSLIYRYVRPKDIADILTYK